MKVTNQRPSFVRPHLQSNKKEHWEKPLAPEPLAAEREELSPYSSLSTESLVAAQAELEGQAFKAGELLIGLDSATVLSEDLQLERLETFNLAASQPQAAAGNIIARVKLPRGITVAEGLAALRSQGQVRFVEANAVVSLDAPQREETLAEDQLRSPLPLEGAGDRGKIPNDLDFRMWAPYNNGRRGGKAGADISAPEAWEKSVGSGEPLIAVIDTGIDYTHPDLADNMWMNPGEIPGDGIDNDENGVVDDVYGYNAYADNGDPLDDHSHGTHCAGTIGAVGNNGLGVTGVNWRANLMAIKIFNKTGQTSTDAILRGLQYAAKMDVDITNNSWGDLRPSQAIKEAFQSMPNAVHFAAAGNNRNNNDHRNYYPVGHDLPNMIGVAASDRRDQKPTFSNYGQKSVELMAPGDQILSTVIDGSYGIYSGTSMACPHAAGIAGLVLSEFPDQTPTQVRDRLLYNSDQMPSLSRYSQSGGRLNASRVLESDTVPPGAPNDFGVKRADSKSVQLSWTTAGDDGWCGGPPADHELWVSSQPITEQTLPQAIPLETPRPEATGELIKVDFPTGHATADRTYHFAFRSVDNVGARSPLKTASTTVASAKEVYSQSFGAADGFQGEDSWARLCEEGNWLWTDSPEGNYSSGSDSSLVSPAISLRGFQNCQLTLDAKHDLWRTDKVLVEATSDGENWETLGTYHGKKPRWGNRAFDLTPFDNQDIQVRIRLKSDLRVNRDGIYVDNFKIVGDAL